MTNINEELVRDYMNGIAIRDIAKNSGVSTQVIYAQLKRLRKAGVKLPNRQKHEPIMVDRLNSIIANCITGKQGK